MPYKYLSGTKIPDGTILVHERGDHYSLQVARPMSLQGTFSLAKFIYYLYYWRKIDANSIMENFFISMKLVPFK